MQDHTKEGVPTSRLSTAEIEECLRDGIEILDCDGHDEATARQMVINRLQLELQIRNMGLC